MPETRSEVSTRGRVAALSLIGCAALGASTLADNAAAAAESSPNTAFLSPVTGSLTGLAGAPPVPPLGSQRLRREARLSDSASGSGVAWAGLSAVACAAVAAQRAKGGLRRRIQCRDQAGYHQTAIIPSGETQFKMTKDEEKEWLAKRVAGLKEQIPQTEEEFADEVDELTWQWGRHLLPYVNKKRDDIASYKRRTILKQSKFFQQLRLFKPLIMKYPTLCKRLNRMEYPHLENKDFEINAEWIKNEEGVAGFSYEDFVKATSGNTFEEWKMPQLGDLVEGKVAATTDEGAFVEIGMKTWAYMPLERISLLTITRAAEVLKVGDEITAEVVDLGATSVIEGDPWSRQVILDMTKLQVESAWEEVDGIMSGQGAQPFVEVEVRSMKTWGAVVQMKNGFEGIIPNSMLADRVGDTSLVGRKIMCEINAVKREGKTSGGIGPQDFAITFSYTNQANKEFAESLTMGEIVDATVVSMRSAANMDVKVNDTTIGVRKVDISSMTDFNLFDLFSVGEEIKMYVVESNPETGMVRLSTRALERSKGQMLEDKAAVFANAEDTAKRYLQDSNVARQKVLSQLESILDTDDSGDEDDFEAPTIKPAGVVDMDDDEDDDLQF